MAVNKKELKRSYVRILKFMLIGVIPNLFLYYFAQNILPEWLLTIFSLLIFLAFGFIGEAIYVGIRNKQLVQAEINEKQNRIEQKRKKENKE